MQPREMRARYRTIVIRTTLTAALWQKVMNEYKLQQDNNHQFHIDKNPFKYVVYGCEQYYMEIFTCKAVAAMLNLPLFIV